MHLNKTLLKLVTLLFVGPVIGEPNPHDCDLARTKPLYLDAEAKIEQRVNDLIIRLNLEEKAMILNHNHPDIERLGLRGDKWNQCLNGVQWDQPTTLFPICTGLAATWDPDFIKNQVVRVISDEARAIYNGWTKDPSLSSQHKGLIYRDPVLNIGRNPYWGRNYEIWGEDPYLTGRMGVAYCQGMHGNDPKYLKLYTRVLQSKVTRPKHELKGFERVSLKAGETKTISIEVLVDRLAYFDEKKNRFIVEAGDYELQIGSSSKEIQLREQMTIHENFNAQLEALPN